MKKPTWNKGDECLVEYRGIIYSATIISTYGWLIDVKLSDHRTVTVPYLKVRKP